ncbi:MAG: ABC transporter permease subunit [Candidatus Cloacimonetes bacterium]|nr:ABC transporter permease subunit [Candidatus Cloacimonadota bacterium]
MIRNALIVARRETRVLTHSLSFYIVIAAFLLITGFAFSSEVFVRMQANMGTMFNTVPTVYLFFIPAITMSLISREKNAGTFELLATLPLDDTEIVLGKFLAALQLVVTALMFTLIQLVTIVLLGHNVDFGPILCGYLGLIMLGGVYCAVGIFASSLTDNQIIAFITGFLILFVFFIISRFMHLAPVELLNVVQYISALHHLERMTRGVLDTRDFLYFITLTVLFLRLAIIALESRKWK